MKRKFAITLILGLSLFSFYAKAQDSAKVIPHYLTSPGLVVDSLERITIIHKLEWLLSNPAYEVDPYFGMGGIAPVYFDSLSIIYKSRKNEKNSIRVLADLAGQP